MYESNRDDGDLAWHLFYTLMLLGFVPYGVWIQDKAYMRFSMNQYAVRITYKWI